MSESAAGWYPQEDGRLRYWDGRQWTEQFAEGWGGLPPVPPVAGGRPSQASTRAWYARKRVLIPTGLLAFVIAVGALGSGGDEPTALAAGNAGTATDGAAVTAPPAKPQAQKPTSAAKPTAKAPAAKPPAKPAAPRVGSTVRDGKFAFTVRSVRCGIAKVGTNPYLTKKAQGQFCAVALTVANIGKEPQSMFADNQYAFDSKQRKFSADTEASIYDDSSQVLWEEVNPGNSVKGTVYFDVPKGTKLATLELHDSMFSGGAAVAVG